MTDMDMDLVLTLTIIIISYFLVWLAGKYVNKMAKTTFSKIEGFNPTYEQVFITKKSGITGIAVDNNTEKFAISIGRGKPYVYKLSQVESAAVEINEVVVQVSSFSSLAVPSRMITLTLADRHFSWHVRF